MPMGWPFLTVLVTIGKYEILFALREVGETVVLQSNNSGADM